MPNRIVINEYIDLVWKDKKPVIYVAGKEFIGCSFLAVSLPAADASRIESIDELADDNRARSLEGRDAMEVLGMSANAIMQAHASNLEAWVENGYDTRILHSNLSFSLLKELAKAGDAKALRVLRGEINDRLASGSRNVAIAIFECCEEYVDEDGLTSLATNGDSNVRWLVARGQNTPAAVLGRLASDGDAGVRLRVAMNPSTPAAVLERLAGDVDAKVRQQVAWNSNTSPALMERLAGDVDIGVRAGVLWNSNVSPAALEKLAGDVDVNVRSGAAGNPKTPAEVLERLAGDVDSDVRAGVAKNPNASARVAKKARGGR